MKKNLLECIVCPYCFSKFAFSQKVERNYEAISGELICLKCNETFLVSDGIPRIVKNLGKMERVSKSFGFQWNQYFEDRFEEETLYGRTQDQDLDYFLYSMGIEQEELIGKRILDAGCGCGRLTKVLGEIGADVVGVDISEAADVAYKNCLAVSNVNILQADIFNLPFPENYFDFVWSNGVIHHTLDANLAHEKLWRVLKPRGKMYIWVYAKRFNPFRFTKDALTTLKIVPNMSPATLCAFCKILSVPSLFLLYLYRGVRRINFLRPSSTWGISTVRKRSYKELCFTWFDALSPQYDSRHTLEEVVSWFETRNFIEIVTFDCKSTSSNNENMIHCLLGGGGIGVRGTKG